MRNDDVIRSTICLLALDGEITKEELQFLQAMQNKLEVAPQVVEQAFELARQGKGQIFLPEAPEERVQLFEILLQAIVADEIVTPQEQRALYAIAGKLGISDTNVAQHLQRKLSPSHGASRPSGATGQTGTSERIHCPKCQFEQPIGGSSCRRCGVIFARLQEMSEERATTSPPSQQSDAPTVEEALNQALPWTPVRTNGSMFRSRRFVRETPFRATLRPSAWWWGGSVSMVVLGGLSFLMMAGIRYAMPPDVRIFPLVFGVLGGVCLGTAGYFVNGAATAMIFDKRQHSFRMEHPLFRTVDYAYVRNMTIPLDDILAIQLVGKDIEYAESQTSMREPGEDWSSSGHDDWRHRHGNTHGGVTHLHEFLLVLHDGTRIHLTDTLDVKALKKDAKALAKFLNKPLLDGAY